MATIDKHNEGYEATLVATDRIQVIVNTNTVVDETITAGNEGKVTYELKITRIA